MEIDELLDIKPSDTEKPSRVTYARNIFLPLTTACLNSCSYCAFYDEPGEAEIMTPEEVTDKLETARNAGCTEALFSFGTRPEAHSEIRTRLMDMGYESILDYLEWACKEALRHGVLPHSNPGLMRESEMRSLKPYNSSMGLMLETTAEIEAHSGFATKQPKRRLTAIQKAGENRIPFTTGLLIGVGETWRDRAESLIAIRELHQRHGHIQEVIIQNVVPNKRSNYSKPSSEDIKRVVAMARYALPDDVEVQVPPNLTDNLPGMIEAGAGDLGGVSPVTVDYINPEYNWPVVDELRDAATKAGVKLEERLPVYPRYIEETRTGRENWIHPKVMDVIEEPRVSSVLG